MAGSSEEGQVISCHTVDAWNDQLQKGNQSKKLIVVDFTASWCGPCRFIAPFLAELAKKFTSVVFLKVDVDELKSVSQDWAIEAMPTFVFVKEGTLLSKVVHLLMDQHRGEVLDPVHDRNLSHSVEGVAIARASISGEVGEVDEDLGSDKELKDDVKGQDKHDQENISDKLPGVDQGTSYNSNNLVNQEVIETVVVIESVQTEYANEDNTKLEAKVDESGLSLVSMKAPKGVSETDKNSCVIDIKCSSRKKIYKSSEGERICRICHLTSGQSSDATTVGTSDSATSADLIQLGCACKGKPGIAHVHCALAWFKLKGNMYLFLPNISLIINNNISVIF